MANAPQKHHLRLSQRRRQLKLVERPLAGLPLAAGRPAPNFACAQRDQVCTIPVKILADDKEPTVRRVWEKQYRERVAAASAIIERYCRVRFEVVAVGTWNSEDGDHDLRQLIAEFERTAKPAPARLAIGWSGQYQTLRGEPHMGGTPAPSVRTSCSANGATTSPNRTGWRCWSTSWGISWARSTRRKAAP